MGQKLVTCAQEFQITILFLSLILNKLKWKLLEFEVELAFFKKAKCS